MAVDIRQMIKTIGNKTIDALLWLGSVPSVLYLSAYIFLIFAFSFIYFVLPGRPFYHSTSQHEYDELNAEANKLLSYLGASIKINLVHHYKTDQLNIRGWLLDTRKLEVHSLSVRNFPEEVSFRMTAPLSRIDPKFGRIETQFRQTVTVPLQGKLIVEGVVFLFLKPVESPPSIIKGIPPEPNWQDMFPTVGKPFSGTAPVLELSPSLYNGIIGFGQGYRGFPSKVKGQYLRMLYFSAGLATASALGDIVPITSTARLLVTIQALLSLVIAGLFLNALAVGIGSAGKRVQDEDSGK